ncbi:hypothetical protein BDV93DRAFT_603735 [Ceratobasidium sp. AG-I]|nr:hypothetical protein BDV93DRAFT_603735 [Ceratobasidium sp. AG-I]
MASPSETLHPSSILALAYTVSKTTTYRTRSDSPICRLPLELLAEIFTVGSLLNSYSSFLVAQVSRHWRALALSMPTLWTSIQLENEAHGMFYYKRSEPLLLDLRASWEDPKKTDLLQTMLRARQNWLRWETITWELINHDEYPPLAYIIFGELYLLARFLHDAESSGQLRHFFFTLLGRNHNLARREVVYFPPISCLEHVELVGVALDPRQRIRPGYFKDMRQLRIASSPGMDTASCIIRLITAMPVLTKLTIEDVKGVGSHEDAWDNRRIVMTCLEKLELIDVGVNIARELVEVIFAPNLRRLVLHLVPLPKFMTPSPGFRAASKYLGLRYLSAFGTVNDTSPILLSWLEQLNELEHLDISRLCQGVTSEVVHAVLKKLADSTQNVCPSLVRLQVGEDCDPETCELLRDVVKSRSGREASGFMVVVSDGAVYKEFVL